MDKVFVTGADGMLGSSICRELLKQSFAVKALCLPGRKTSTLENLPIEIVYGDISDREFLSAAMKDCSFVIHAAALTNVWPRKSERVRRVNLEGTRNVMEVAEVLKINRMIYIGSASSFRHGPKDNPGDESSAFAGWKFGMDYINSKYQAQVELLNKHRETGFPVIIINPTFMIGPFDYGPTSGQILIALAKGTLKWYSRGGKNFVCSVDVATAAVNALSKGVFGECYIAGNENLEYKEFFIKACKILKKRFSMRVAPTPLILTIGFLSSFLSRIIGKPPKISYGMALMAKENQYFSASKAHQVLEMPQTPIEVGIEQCLHWFKEHKYL